MSSKSAVRGFAPGPAKAAHDLYIARITAVEVTSAITRRQHSGHLSPAQGGAMLGHFRRHLAQRYHVIEFTPVLIDQAMQVAPKHRLRATTPSNWPLSSICTDATRMPD